MSVYIYVGCILMLGITGQQDYRTGSFPHQQQLSLLSANIDFIVPNVSASVSVGYLVIVPHLRFACHGYIAHWHARTWLKSGESAIDHLYHDITF